MFVAMILAPLVVAGDFEAYPDVATMPNPLPPALSCGDLDGPSESKNWTSLLVGLIRKSMTTALATTTTGRFESLYCMGNQKSGTTSFGLAARRLGYVELLGRARQIAPKTYHRNFYQNGVLSAEEVRKYRAVLNRSTLFEDDPWFVLHRLADASFLEWRRRVGYVLTVRHCASLAESSAAFNNPANGRGGNSPTWNAQHCSRHYRRCHVHLLDVYNWLDKRGRPLDDVLILETARGWRSQANWAHLVDFACAGTSRHIYAPGDYPKPSTPSYAKCLAVLEKHPAMPSANSRSALSQSRTFCPPQLLEEHAQRPLSGRLIHNLPPQPPNHGQCRRKPQLPGC